MAGVPIEDLVKRTQDALARAMRIRGLRHASEFHQLISSEYASGTIPKPRTMQRWIYDEGAEPPAWALVAAAKMAGVSIEELLGEPENASIAELREQVKSMSARLEAMGEAMGESKDLPASGE